MEGSVRPATEADLGYMWDLHRKESDSLGFIPESRWRLSLDYPGADVLVYQENGDPVGYVFAGHNRHGIARVYQLAVQEDARLSRRASALLDSIIRPSDCLLSARVGTKYANLDFWPASGFEPVRREAGGLSRARDVVTFHKVTGGLWAPQEGNP